MRSFETEHQSLESKKRLLKSLLRQKAGLRKKTHPMSMGQTAIFLDYLKHPKSAAYNILISCKIMSDIDHQILNQAYQLLVDRHEILRTTYGLKSKIAVQTIHGHMDVIVEQMDFPGCDETSIQEKLIIESKKPFDLFLGPVVRICLYSANEGDYYFIMVMHHIAGDGRTLSNLFEELLATHNKLDKGASISSFGMPPSQYTDFVKWEQNLLKSPLAKDLESFWDKTLEGVPPVLELQRLR
ncbi:MAG: hypothetical protein GY729_02820, partial [Desulfobacteraceae bacterium]|nr:hypothetical protein [Desulfobacteraceae bacterium]